MSLLVLDFEASALENGFPIEVAIADVAAREIRAWLIRPAAAWVNLDWVSASAQVHGLMRQKLDAGTPTDIVAAEMLAFAAAREVASDNPTFDGRWLRQLFEAADLPLPVVAAESVGQTVSLIAHEHGRTPADIDALNRARKAMAAHTAALDAASWAAAAEAAAVDGDLDLGAIDRIFEEWIRLAEKASPWRAVDEWSG